jgi:hypothetical protein
MLEAILKIQTVFGTELKLAVNYKISLDSVVQVVVRFASDGFEPRYPETIVHGVSLQEK